MLLDADRSLIFGDSRNVHRLTLNPIRVAGEIVGYLGVFAGTERRRAASLLATVGAKPTLRVNARAGHWG